ncbi:Serine aminopeptidase, S33,Alpha/Beta hydrolase fold [Cinara cedri]|uniref:Serine aminopeptidase, S33,Alpha/Beta hydrolase fold n=1 Tax=Cinara cedri TaxID=506608 RepID=A0A5E4MW72_9HEMI|nr:Serine aminopeptidase, S33,Alpha/Beta hydrolase fold [Cinara cedri]
MCNCNKRKACTTALGVIGVTLFVIFIVFPAVWRYSPSLQRSMLFLNRDFLSEVQNYSHPEVYGLNGTRNFYIHTNDNVTLGVWHVLPRNLLTNYTAENELNYEQFLSHGEPIIIYMHGNSDARTNEQRVELYRKLQDMDYHVIALDYRGYGDSTDVDIIDETGLVSDVMQTFKWVYERANGTPIFGWGHSLGTGIGAHAFSLLEKENIYSNGLILEAPFNKMSEAIRQYSTAKAFRNLPWFDFFIIDPVIENGNIFDTEENLKDAKMPVLILHAQDDLIIPYHQSEKLCSYITKFRKNTLTDIVLYPSEYGLGHQLIVRDKTIGNTIKKFIIYCLKTESP